MKKYPNKRKKKKYKIQSRDYIETVTRKGSVCACVCAFSMMLARVRS